jgi:hypothetical protein
LRTCEDRVQVGSVGTNELSTAVIAS